MGIVDDNYWGMILPTMLLIPSIGGARHRILVPFLANPKPGFRVWSRMIWSQDLFWFYLTLRCRGRSPNVVRARRGTPKGHIAYLSSSRPGTMLRSLVAGESFHDDGPGPLLRQAGH